MCGGHAKIPMMLIGAVDKTECQSKISIPGSSWRSARAEGLQVSSFGICVRSSRWSIREA